MWNTKYFKTKNEAEQFINKIKLQYQFTLIYIQDGYGVEYKRLRTIL